MSTHNIGFYEDLKKIIFQLSSNIIKYALYLFFCSLFPQEDELKKAILVVFANKQDIEGAMTVSEVANALGLTNIKAQKYQIFKTSAIKGTGLDEAMEW